MHCNHRDNECQVPLSNTTMTFDLYWQLSPYNVCICQEHILVSCSLLLLSMFLATHCCYMNMCWTYMYSVEPIPAFLPLTHTHKTPTRMLTHTALHGNCPHEGASIANLSTVQGAEQVHECSCDGHHRRHQPQG